MTTTNTANEDVAAEYLRLVEAAKDAHEVKMLCRGVRSRVLSAPYETASQLWIRLRDKIIKFNLVHDDEAKNALTHVMQLRDTRGNAD